MTLVKKNSFEELVNNLSYVHEVLQGYASKSINQFLSLRNWLFGYYIVEYEQNGEDRAKYGENLIANITQKVKYIKGLTGNQLYVCRNFYLLYPHFLRTVSVILQHLNIEMNTILRSVSAKSSVKENTVEIEKSTKQNNDTQLEPDLLLFRLSYTHFVELLRVKEPSERLFYE